MGNNGYSDYDDDNYDEDQNGPSALRQHNKKLEKQLKDLQALADKQADALATFEKTQRRQSVAEVLQANGVNPKVSALIPADVEPTEAGVKAWLAEFGDVFGVQAPSGDTPSAEEQVAAAKTPLEEEEDPEALQLRAAWEAVAAASTGTGPTHVDQLASTSLEQIRDSTGSFEEAKAALAKLPGFRVAEFQS